MNEKVQFFDRLAADRNPFPLNAAARAALERMLGDMGPLRGAEVLEPGCGAGALTPLVLDRIGETGRVTAFDPSPEMLARCRAVCPDDPRLRLLEGRVEDLDFPAAAFDLILCYRVLPHFDDLPAVLQRMRRWVRPAGRLVIAHTDGREALNRIHRDAGGAVDADIFPPRPELEDTLRRAGWSPGPWRETEQEIFILARPGASTCGTKRTV